MVQLVLKCGSMVAVSSWRTRWSYPPEILKGDPPCVPRVRWTTAQLPRRESRSRVSDSSRHKGWQKKPAHPGWGSVVSVARVCTFRTTTVSEDGLSGEASWVVCILGCSLCSFVWLWCCMAPCWAHPWLLKALIATCEATAASRFERLILKQVRGPETATLGASVEMSQSLPPAWFCSSTVPNFIKQIVLISLRLLAHQQSLFLSPALPSFSLPSPCFCPSLFYVQAMTVSYCGSADTSVNGKTHVWQFDVTVYHAALLPPWH